MKKQNPTRMVTTQAEAPRLAENVAFDIWTRCISCTHSKIRDHSWKPGHKLEWGRKKKKMHFFDKYILLRVNCDNCCVNENLCK